MTDHKAVTHSPVTFAGGVLDPYRHVCVFVDSRTEMHRIFDPFMAEGLARGERLSLVVGPEERADWVRHMRHLGLDPARLFDLGQIEIRSWWEADGRENHFDMYAMIRLLDELLNGFPSPRIRLISEMGWAVDHSDELLEFEARANYLLPNHEHVVFCVYDTSQFSSDILIDVLRTHPMALIGGMLQVNPFFVPAEEFLATGRFNSEHTSAERTTQDEAEALAAPRRDLRDLAIPLALPAMWANQEPADIAAGLLDVLFGMFRLESGYVSFDDYAGGPALECWRPAGERIPIEFEKALATPPTREHGVLTAPVTTPPGDGTIHVTSMCPALPGVDGLVLIGSRRPTFPNESEMRQLRVIVAQATVSIHTARRLASEYMARTAAEAALRQRNQFLTSLAQELMAPLTTLAERAAEAQTFATEANRGPVLSHAINAASGMLASDALSPLNSSAERALITRLSRREGEVLGLVAQGLSNKEIAGTLSLSERTVERHITSLYRKIGARRRTEATVYALRNGFATMDTREE